MIVDMILLNPKNHVLKIKNAIKSCIDHGMMDKQGRYAKVVNDLNIPRPTVRRAVGNLRVEISREIETPQACISDIGEDA